MKELIKIGINKNKEPVVNGRELHKKLKSKEHYVNWIKRHLDYGYRENIDYVILKGYLLESGFVEENSFNNKNIINRNNESMRGKSAIDHALTLDTAKEIAMLQRNEIGRQIRLYFIKFEKEHQAPPSNSFAKILKVPTTEKQLKRNKMLENKGWVDDDIDIRQLSVKANTLFKKILAKKGLGKYQIIELTRIINRAIFGMDANELKKLVGVSKWYETRNILPKNVMLLNFLFAESNIISKIDDKDKMTYPQIKEIVLNVCEAVKIINDSSMVLQLNNNTQSNLDKFLKPVNVITCY